MVSKAGSKLQPVPENTLLYSVLIPAYNEERNIIPTLEMLAEKLRAEFIARGNRRVTVLDRTSLTSLAGHLIRSRGVIAVDTGLGHLAAALNKPTISLYGPTDPNLSGTFGAQQLHLNSNLPCAPCVKKTCAYTGPGFSDDFEDQPFAITPPCFSTHKPDTVWQQFEHLIGLGNL